MMTENVTESYRKKALSLIAKMSLEEKIRMVHGNELFRTGAVERLGIPALIMSDGPCGVRQDFKPSKWEAIGTSRDEVSYLPCNSAIAATFNKEIAYEAGKVLGEETRGRGKDMILAPGVNIKRSPLCGRNFEYFSEDPYLTKKMAVPLIKGIQENDVAACIKHFAANNQETARHEVDTIADEETLDEIYFPAFKAAVEEANVHALMGAYNKINGEYCCQSNHLLNDVLRNKWNFDGVVVSDWGGVDDTYEAAQSGLDIEMDVTDDFDNYNMAEPLKEAVKLGEISEGELDKKLEHILILMQRLHMIGTEARKSGSYNTFAHQQKLLEAAEESIVLLKNEEDVLPIKIKDKEKILIVGENGDKKHAPGGGSAEIKALYEVTPLQGLQMELGGNAEIMYAQGYTSGADTTQDSGWQAMSLKDQENKDFDKEYAEKSKSLREEAIKMAKEADRVIFIGGLNHDEDKEGYDRKDMSLPYGQAELIAELQKIDPDMIVVMIGGNPCEMQSWVDSVKGMLYMFYNGMEGGRALAEVILGKVNPSGRLPVSFYRRLEDCSAHSNGEFAKKDEVVYREGVYVGYRHLQKAEIDPLFAFGYGLSYSEFEITSGKRKKSTGKTTEISVEVANKGKYAGAFVIEVFKYNPKYDYKELCGFEKVRLSSGEKKQVSFEAEAVDEDKLYIGENYRSISLEV